MPATTARKPAVTYLHGFRIERRPDAHGTNLVEKDQPVIVMSHPRGFHAVLGRWSSMGRKTADRCTDAELVKAVLSDQSVYARDEPVDEKALRNRMIRRLKNQNCVKYNKDRQFNTRDMVLRKADRDYMVKAYGPYGGTQDHFAFMQGEYMLVNGSTGLAYSYRVENFVRVQDPA